MQSEPAIATVYGNKSGLKKSELSALEKLYRKKVPSSSIITPELARHLCTISASINRQLGLLVLRNGVISHVIVGDTNGIFIPSLEDYPQGRKVMRGMRLVHTHLRGEPLNQDDLTDLALLRLDTICAIDVHDEQLMHVQTAHLGPDDIVQEVMDLYDTPHFGEFMSALEQEMDRKRSFEQGDMREKAILVSVSSGQRHLLEDSIEELRELAKSSNVLVLDTVIQKQRKVNAKTLLGEGKLKELVVKALNLGATILIFDQDLTPSQIKNLAAMTELKVIDRSQLILDIFSRRAHSGDGRVQVELAQLKYSLPRLMGKGTAMSRLMGGIGGRGPGENKLEVDRRKVRTRISLLEKKLKSLGQARKQRKQKRAGRGIPIVSIVGYTNAGKSTLLNTLTNSDTIVENKLFATLDTASRRLRFPREREVIITDTVGFIRDLPADLMAAFAATLEELNDADLLLHLVDASNPRHEQHIASVKRVLEDLGIEDKSQLIVFNKVDKIEADEATHMALRYKGLTISALDKSSLKPLMESIENTLWLDKVEQDWDAAQPE